MDYASITSVLLDCLSRSPSENPVARLAQFGSDEWQYLIQLAERHGVTPLLYHRLKASGLSAGIPRERLQTLRTAYLGSAHQNTQLYHELARVLQLLQRENIPAIVLKGAHLAEAVYGNIALRPMGDVDLLIRYPDLLRVENLLLENGYRPDRHNGPFTEETHFHFVYIHAGSGLPLEMHWHILQPPYAANMDLDQLWQRARPASLAGVETLVFSPEDVLLYLCLHLLHHKFDAGLRALCDLDEVMRHYAGAMDWEKIKERSHAWQTDKAIYLSLWLSKDLIQASAPAEIIAALRPPDAAAHEMAAREQILNHGVTSLSLSAPGVMQLGKRYSLPQKTAALLSAVFPTPEHISRLCPVSAESPWVYFYYPMYLRNQLKLYGQQAWRLLRGDTELTRQAAQLADLDHWLKTP